MTPIAFFNGVRTPMGRFGGSFKDIPPTKLAAELIQKLLQNAGFEKEEVVEVILGQCRQTGHGPNPARSAALWGGLSDSIPSSTINMACPSGLVVFNLAKAILPTYDKGIIIVGGMDSMSTIPYLLKKCRFDGFKMGNKVLEDGWSDSIDPVINMNMGQTAELVADRYGLTREELDKYAVLSQKRAADARTRGYLKSEIQPAFGCDEDETIRPDTNLEKIKLLPAVFKKDGKITAANSCTMADSAAVMVCAAIDRFPNQSAFILKDMVSLGCDPKYMGIAPPIAIKKLMERNGLQKKDIELLEINEAFAAQLLSNSKDLGWPPEEINLWGGAIAFGHPTGMSGARLMVTLTNQMIVLDKGLGIAAICGAGGVTAAALVERVR